MKNKILTTVLFLFTVIAQAQFSPPNDISVFLEKPSSVQAADLDGDGDIDVVATSVDDETVAWFRNLDGEGEFGDQIVIDTFLGSAFSLTVADIDGDDDIDIISASSLANQIRWYENLNGAGSFGPAQEITSNIFNARIRAFDIDGDDDLDLIAGTTGSVVWFENLNGNGDFGTEQIVTTDVVESRGIYSADLDGDNDMDLISGSFFDDKVAWYENLDGMGNFGPQQVLCANCDGASFVWADDLDNDGDQDIIATTSLDDKIWWFRNNGPGNFTNRIELASNVEGLNKLFTADIDNDFDKDLVVTNSPEDKLLWFENTNGNGNFGSEQVVAFPFPATSVVVADVNGDGKKDIVAGSFDDRLSWFENQLTLGLYDDTIVPELVLYPNPATDYIDLLTNIPIDEVAIYSVTGNELLRINSPSKLNLSSLSSGVYMVNVTFSDGRKAVRKITKK